MTIANWYQLSSQEDLLLLEGGYIQCFCLNNLLVAEQVDWLVGLRW